LAQAVFDQGALVEGAISPGRASSSLRSRESG